MTNTIVQKAAYSSLYRSFLVFMQQRSGRSESAGIVWTPANHAQTICGRHGQAERADTIHLVLVCRARHNTTMTAISKCFLVIPVFVIAAIPVPGLRAQRAHPALPETPQLELSHRLEIRVLAGGGVAARVKDRMWSDLFRHAGYRVRIESDNGSRTPGIYSRDTGRTPVVEVVGLISRRNVLHIGDRRFRSGDVEPLKEFLDGLAEHGADGPIRLRPTWGLSVTQFEDVLKLLSEKVRAEEVPLSSPVQAVTAVQLSSRFRVTWHERARKLVLSKQWEPRSIDLRSISQGSGLAIALAQFGLGFRVMSDPRGGFVLEIDAGDEAANLWPVGWKNKQPLTGVVPKLYQPVTVDLPNENVSEVIDAVAARINLPHFCSRQCLSNGGIEFDQIRYSAPLERRSPSGLLRSIGGRHAMGFDVRTDEAGQLFLWCTTAGDQKSWKKRFAHVVPGKND